jgi:prepilin signal peptidase PulO-like enzyme (type II secretory pathway)
MTLGFSYALLGAVLGLMVGSAINAFVWRLKVGRSWVRGRSECPECGHALAARDLVPVLSWIELGGKCRYCRKPIQDHPVVELVSGAAFGLSAYLLLPVGPDGLVRVVLWLVALTMLLILAVYDYRWMILPDKVVLPLIAVALAYSAGLAIMTGSPQMILGPLEAALLAGGGFLALVMFSRGRAMGGGDIKLVVAMGLLLGLRGTALALLVAFNTAAVVGIALMVARRRGRKDHIAFGPFLVAGTVVAFLFGQSLADWYVRISGL